MAAWNTFAPYGQTSRLAATSAGSPTGMLWSERAGLTTGTSDRPVAQRAVQRRHRDARRFLDVRNEAGAEHPTPATRSPERVAGAPPAKAADAGAAGARIGRGRWSHLRVRVRSAALDGARRHHATRWSVESTPRVRPAALARGCARPPQAGVVQMRASGVRHAGGSRKTDMVSGESKRSRRRRVTGSTLDASRRAGEIGNSGHPIIASPCV